MNAPRDAVPPETWFFRYPASFEHLRRQAARRSHFRIASLGCACGAEAFSIAAALEEITRASIVAIDSSAAEVAAARAGRLRPMSVRGDLPSWARKPWTKDGDAIVVRSALRERVDFREHDALAGDLRRVFGEFDAVFCRNLLIYFDEHDRRRLGEAIASILRPGGWLYLGHAEQPSALGLSWRGRSGAAFAFRSPASGEPALAGDAPPPGAGASSAVIDGGAEDRGARTRLRGAARNAAPSARRAAGQSDSTRPETPRRRTAAPSPPSLDTVAIRTLADAGRRDAAIAAARRRHEAGDRDPALLELLGTLELAEGRLDEAERHLRAVLYLDPKREEAALGLDLVRARRRGPKERA